MDKFNIILEAEQQFAREVTLGVIVTRPLTVWHTIIPGFFIIDFLRRGSAIRQYSKHFMFPRKIALDAAVTEERPDEKESLESDAADNIRIWLEAMKLYTPSLVKAHMELIRILTLHYQKLLKADGDTMNVLIEHAYQNSENFKQFIEKITAAENEVDRQVVEQLRNHSFIK